MLDEYEGCMKRGEEKKEVMIEPLYDSIGGFLLEEFRPTIRPFSAVYITDLTKWFQLMH